MKTVAEVFAEALGLTPENAAFWLGEAAKTFGYTPSPKQVDGPPPTCFGCLDLQERLDDLVESHKRTVAEACNPPAGDDRLHCHCVPALRAEVAELTEKLKRAEHIKYKDDRHVDRLNEARNGLINEVADLRQLLAQHGICWGCGCMADGCGPALWAQGKKCCPDCSHG